MNRSFGLFYRIKNSNFFIKVQRLDIYEKQQTLYMIIIESQDKKFVHQKLLTLDNLHKDFTK
jgi:hypothetical protein